MEVGFAAWVAVAGWDVGAAVRVEMGTSVGGMGVSIEGMGVSVGTVTSGAGWGV